MGWPLELFLLLCLLEGKEILIYRAVEEAEVLRLRNIRILCHRKESVQEVVVHLCKLEGKVRPEGDHDMVGKEACRKVGNAVEERFWVGADPHESPVILLFKNGFA